MSLIPDGSKNERLDYKTHLKYASTIADLSDNLKITTSIEPQLSSSNIVKLDDKIKLIKLTKESIDQEYQIVCFDKEYSTSSVLWLPIKTYYLIYHLLCVTDCIIGGKLSSLSAGHYDCINRFTKMLECSTIQFNISQLNSIYDNSIFSFTTKSGEHLKNAVTNDIIYKLLMKKIAQDKVDNYKITNGLSGRLVKDKAKIYQFKRNIKISIFDYFHIMRLRMNYRNLNFVDSLSSYNTKAYFEQYYICADNFFKCFSTFINLLVKKIQG